MNGQRQREILVIGAASVEAEAVAHHMLDKDWCIRLITPEPIQPQARRLHSRGAVTVSGDIENGAALKAAVDGVHGIFMALDCQVRTLHELVRKTLAVVDAAEECAVKHVVLLSRLLCSNRCAESEASDSLSDLHARLGRSRVTWTTLHPALLFESLTTEPALATIFRAGVIKLPYPKYEVVPFVALVDEVRFVSYIFEDPVRFSSRKIRLVGDWLSPDRMAGLIGRAAAMPVSYTEQPAMESALPYISQAERLVSLRGWFACGAAHDSGEAIEPDHTSLPSPRTAEEWVRQVDWNALCMRHFRGLLRR